MQDNNNHHIFLEGENLYLRAIEEKDLNGAYFQWLNDEEVTKYNSHGRFPNTPKKQLDYFNSLQNTDKSLVLAIIDKKTNFHIGNISLQNINWIDSNAEFAILMGDKNFWGKGYSTQAGELIIKHAFEKLNLHRIYCATSIENIGMQKLAKKLQMTQEGIRKEAIFKAGKYLDIVEFGLINIKQ